MSPRSPDADFAIEVFSARRWIRHMDTEGAGNVPAALSAEFLREVGSTAEIGEMIGALRAAEAGAEAADLMADELDRPGGTLEAVRRATHLLDVAREYAAMIEQRLEAVGLRWDASEHRLEWRSDGRKGPSRHYATDLILEAWHDLQPVYERETGDGTWSAQELREWIAEALRHDLPPDELDTSPRGTIDNAIGNYARSRR